MHAHEYDRNVKLDAITGDIFDATTRDRCMRLKKGKLLDIQARLRESPDFAALLQNTSTGPIDLPIALSEQPSARPTSIMPDVQQVGPFRDSDALKWSGKFGQYAK